MRRIVIATANRAERGLLEPIIARLKQEPNISFQMWEYVGSSPDWNYYFDDRIPVPWAKPDVILIPCDRKEMVPLAAKCYYEGIPVFHLFAGVGYTGTYDDLNRRVISSFSYLMLAEDAAAKRRLVSSGEEEWRIRIVGSTHMDDMEMDDSMVPNEPYDLVLINPNPADERDTMLTIKTAAEATRYPRVLWVEPNEPFAPGMQKFLKELMRGRKVDYLPSQPRPKFLGLMNHAKRFISNSSSMWYEAPYLKANARGTVVVPIGERNKHRETSTNLKPAAATVAKLLAEYPLDKAKMLKRYGITKKGPYNV